MSEERDEILKAGKLDLSRLEKILSLCPVTDPRVVMGPRVGEDTAVIDAGDRYLVVKTDPITFVSSEMGWYAVHVNANDIAVSGARPLWFTVAILLPEGESTFKTVEDLMGQLASACQSIGVSLVGGHTEVTPGIDRPLIVGHMLGEVEKAGLVTTAGAAVGDDLILTKGIALEGTSIIAREKGEELVKRGFSQERIERCRDFLYEPGISVLDEALIACRTVRVHSMHDPTEGGLATGLHELAAAADVGLRVREEAIPVFDECSRLCHEFGLNPLGLIASGSLIIAVDERDSPRLLEEYERRGISAQVIGKVLDKEEGIILVTRRGEEEPLPLFTSDEITKLP